MSELKRNLIVFLAHIDDIELSCLSYVFKNYKEYDEINFYLATKWQPKEQLWSQNLEKIRLRCPDIKINYFNLEYNQRILMTKFDKLKDKFYSQIKFSKNTKIDMLTHDLEDCHTDHVAIAMISKGLFKYTDRYITVYSPSTTNFKPNLWIELSEEDYFLKKEMCDVYNVNNEQSYTNLGYYLQSESHYNIGKAYEIENFAVASSKYSECFKILKWR